MWPTIEGNLSWDANGSPKGNDSLVEWVGGKLLPVYPADVARHAPIDPEARLEGLGPAGSSSRPCTSSSRPASWAS